jgi:SnoaL-like domain
MTLEQTRATMDRYFELMDDDEDFSECDADDVRWLMADSGQEVRGRTEIREYVNELHRRMLSVEYREMVVTEEHAYIEGDAINADASNPGLSVCAVFDVSNGLITDIRCYGTLAALMET